MKFRSSQEFFLRNLLTLKRSETATGHYFLCGPRCNDFLDLHAPWPRPVSRSQPRINGKSEMSRFWYPRMVEGLHAILGDGFRWAKGGAVDKLPETSPGYTPGDDHTCLAKSLYFPCFSCSCVFAWAAAVRSFSHPLDVHHASSVGQAISHLSSGCQTPGWWLQGIMLIWDQAPLGPSLST